MLRSLEIVSEDRGLLEDRECQNRDGKGLRSYSSD